MAKAKRKTPPKTKKAGSVRLVKDRDGTFSLRGLNADDLGTLAILTGATIPGDTHPFILSTVRLFNVLCMVRDNNEPGMEEWDRFYHQGMGNLIITSDGDKLVVHATAE